MRAIIIVKMLVASHNLGTAENASHMQLLIAADCSYPIYVLEIVASSQ